MKGILLLLLKRVVPLVVDKLLDLLSSKKPKQLEPS